jgi:hypothetical protein
VVGCTIGSRGEVPGEREPVIRGGGGSSSSSVVVVVVVVVVVFVA